MTTLSPSQRTRIKICGITREVDLEEAVAAGADAVGFVLYEPSPRYVSLARAVALAQRLPPQELDAPQDERREDERPDDAAI